MLTHRLSQSRCNEYFRVAYPEADCDQANLAQDEHESCQPLQAIVKAREKTKVGVQCSVECQKGRTASRTEISIIKL